MTTTSPAADGAPEASAGDPPVPGTDTVGDGPAVGEHADEFREDDAGAVGPTAVDPVAPDRAPAAGSGPVLLGRISRMVALTVDGTEIRVPEGATILDALHTQGSPEQADTPTLCWAPNLNPINACRVCVVEVEGSRVLVPSCARGVEDGMEVRTDTEKVRHSRRMVLELLASSADMSQASADVQRWMGAYGVQPERYGEKSIG